MHNLSSVFRRQWKNGFRIYAQTRNDWTGIDMPSEKGYVVEEPDIPLMRRINRFRELRRHVWMWGEEFVERIRNTFRLHWDPDHEDIFVQFKFNDPEVFKKFQFTADSEHEMGYSKANLDRTKAGTALFHGSLDTTVPKDGVSRRAGFAAMKSKKKIRSFYRRAFYTDWNPFTHLLLKVRGDGRTYVVMLGCPGEFDFQKANVYAYPLYTHGGPYWQYELIPFSKFYLTVNGRIPDNNGPVIKYKHVVGHVNKIQSVGITLMDRITGPFQLEIDWIGVYHDRTHFEEWAYEFYKPPTLNF